MSDDNRLNRIEDKLDKMIETSALFQGEFRQFVSNSTSYVEAVSKKTDDIRVSLEAHKVDKDAHGAGVKRDIDTKLIGWAGVGATVMAGLAGFIGAEFHKLWSSK